MTYELRLVFESEQTRDMWVKLVNKLEKEIQTVDAIITREKNSILENQEEE